MALRLIKSFFKKLGIIIFLCLIIMALIAYHALYLQDFKYYKLDALSSEILNKGRGEMGNHKLIIAAISRDNAEALNVMRRNIERTGALFKDYRVIVFENDSKDGTKDFLRRWERRNPKIKYLSEDYNNKKRPSIQFMAEARNKYLDYVHNNPEYDDFDMLMVVDMDMSHGWDDRGLADSFAKISRWDVVCSNGLTTNTGRHYDMFAFRSKNLNEYFDLDSDEFEKIYAIGDDLLEVDSCFGGLVFYKKRYLSECKYSSRSQYHCEHVDFHECLRGNGAKIYMNPSQIILYSHYPLSIFERMGWIVDKVDPYILITTMLFQKLQNIIYDYEYQEIETR